MALGAVAVPMRTTSALNIGLDLYSTFLLTQVDGTSSIAEIARKTHMPVREAMQCFSELRAKGVIELTTVSNVEASNIEAPPKSDVYVCAAQGEDAVPPVRSCASDLGAR